MSLLSMSKRLHAARAKPELIDNNTSPDANIGLLEDDSLSCNKKSAISALETIEGDSSHPMPFYVMDDDLGISGKVAKMSKPVSFGAPSYDEEPILYPPPEQADSVHEPVGLNVGRSAPSGDIEHAIHGAHLHLTREPTETPLIEAWAVEEQSL